MFRMVVSTIMDPTGRGSLGMRLGGKGEPGNEAWGEGGAWE